MKLFVWIRNTNKSEIVFQKSREYKKKKKWTFLQEIKSYQRR